MSGRVYSVTVQVTVNDPAALARAAARRALPKDEVFNRWVAQREYRLDPAEADLAVFLAPVEVPGADVTAFIVTAVSEEP